MCLTKDMIILWVGVVSCMTAYANTIQLMNINSRGFEESLTHRCALYRSLAGRCTLAVRYRSPSKPLHNLPNFPPPRCQLIKLLTVCRNEMAKSSLCVSGQQRLLPTERPALDAYK